MPGPGEWFPATVSSNFDKISMRNSLGQWVKSKRERVIKPFRMRNRYPLEQNPGRNVIGGTAAQQETAKMFDYGVGVGQARWTTSGNAGGTFRNNLGMGYRRIPKPLSAAMASTPSRNITAAAGDIAAPTVGKAGRVRTWARGTRVGMAASMGQDFMADAVGQGTTPLAQNVHALTQRVAGRRWYHRVGPMPRGTSEEMLRGYPRWMRKAKGITRKQQRTKPPWGSIARMRHWGEAKRLADHPNLRKSSDFQFNRYAPGSRLYMRRMPRAGTNTARVAKWFGRRVYQPPVPGSTEMRGLVGRFLNIGMSPTSYGARAASAGVTKAAQRAPWVGKRFGVGRITRSFLSKPQIWGPAAIGAGFTTGILRGVLKEGPKLLQENLEIMGMGGMAGPVAKEAIKDMIGMGAGRDLGAQGAMVFGMRKSRHGGYL